MMLRKTQISTKQHVVDKYGFQSFSNAQKKYNSLFIVLDRYSIIAVFDSSK